MWPSGKSSLKNSNERQTSETVAPGDGSDSQANWESILTPFSVVVSFGDFRNGGIRTAHRDSPATALLGAAVASSFAMARSSSPWTPRADDNQSQL